jgi:hypothetical protein
MRKIVGMSALVSALETFMLVAILVADGVQGFLMNMAVLTETH